MGQLTVAVVGAGDIGRAHLFTWQALSGSRVVSICDTDGNSVARLANEFAVDAYTHLQAALEAASVDIVDICSSDAAEFTRLALRFGANVLCPAVPAETVAEIEALAGAASSRERFVMPAFLFRFHPITLTIKDLVDADDIGAPTMFRCRISGQIAQPGSTDAVNGPLLHAADLFRFVCGDVDAASGWARSEADVEGERATGAVVAVRGKRATVGVLEGSSDLIAARTCIEVYGTAGGCVADFEMGIVRYTTAESPFWRSRDEAGEGALERLLAHFSDVVRGLQAPVCTLDDSAKALAVCCNVAAGGVP